MASAEWAMVAFAAERDIQEDECEFTHTKLAYQLIVNSELEQPAIFYTCHKKVSVDYGGHSPWHGYVYDEGDHLNLKFHWTGDEDKARTASVHKQRKGFYHGYDCCGREISLKFLRSYRFCLTCEVWH